MSSKQGIKFSENEDLLEETEILCETGDTYELLGRLLRSYFKHRTDFVSVQDNSTNREKSLFSEREVSER